MGDFLNWMTLFGVGLIIGGVGLMTVALKGASDLRPGRRRPSGRTTAPPQIRPSALLADTVWVPQSTSAPTVGLTPAALTTGTDTARS